MLLTDGAGVETGLEVVELGVGTPDSSISPDVGLDVGMPVTLLPDVALKVGLSVTLLQDVGSEVTLSVETGLEVIELGVGTPDVGSEVTLNVGEGDDVPSAEVGDGVTAGSRNGL